MKKTKIVTFKGKKYIITKDLFNDIQLGDKYCGNCGRKNVVVFHGDYDEETGLPNALYVCCNPKCSYGKFYKAYTCLAEGGHSFKRLWVIGPRRCTKCGKYSLSFACFAPF